MAKETFFINEQRTVEIKGRMTDTGNLEILIRERKGEGMSLTIELNGPDTREFIDHISKEVGYCSE